MGWMSTNWIWIVIAIAIAYFFLRRGRGAPQFGHGARLLEGTEPRGGRGGNHDHGGAENLAPEAEVDPVGGEAVRTNQALTSLHEGRVYYFASKENRERFEASPQEYAAKTSGHEAPGPGKARGRPHRHGCC